MEDAKLKTLVEQELDWQPGIDTADIGVTVENGIVRLSGRVPNYAQKVAAEAAVKRIKGVRGFAEDLEIRSGAATYSDEAVANRIANVLDWNVSVPAGAVQVKVEDGFVTLTGTVDWQYQRDAAERVARPQQGVRGLSNQIALKPHVQAGDIQRRIEEALKRQADIEADKITVSVMGGKVTLGGRVRAFFERDTAERAAWAAPGVTAVEDRIAVGF